MAVRMPMRMNHVYQRFPYRTTEHIADCSTGEAMARIWTRVCDHS